MRLGRFRHHPTQWAQNLSKNLGLLLNGAKDSDLTIPRDGLETENVKDYVVKYLVKSSSHTVGSERTSVKLSSTTVENATIPHGGLGTAIYGILSEYIY